MSAPGALRCGAAALLRGLATALDGWDQFADVERALRAAERLVDVLDAARVELARKHSAMNDLHTELRQERASAEARVAGLQADHRAVADAWRARVRQVELEREALRVEVDRLGGGVEELAAKLVALKEERDALVEEQIALRNQAVQDRRDLERALGELRRAPGGGDAPAAPEEG